MVKFAPLAAVAALAVLAQAVYAQPESNYDHDKAFLDAAHSLSTSHGHKIRVVMQEGRDAKSRMKNIINPLTCSCAVAVQSGCCGIGSPSPLLQSSLFADGVKGRDLSRRAHDNAFMAAARELVTTSSGSSQERALVQVRDDQTGLYSTTVCRGPIENCKLSVDIA